MIALVILLIVMLALMQTVTLGISSNVTNLLRDEATKIAELRIAELRNKLFTDGALAATAGTDEVPVTRREFRNFAVDFTRRRTITDLGGDDKRVDITITWEWRNRTVAGGNPYTYTVSTIVRRP
jgi:hypothetical protein